MIGKIIKSTGSWYQILGEDAQMYDGRLKGIFKTHGLKVSNPIAVGDEVEFEKEGGNINTVSINKILPRRNYIIRKSVHKTAHGHMIAANVDQSILVVTLVNPRTSLGFIDRFLVTCEAFRIPALLAFNKSDLFEEAHQQVYENLKEIYEKLGYVCFQTSAVNNDGINKLKDKLLHKTSLISGHSGVGKSTLLNALLPGLNLKTAAISSFADKGVHTTTFAEMFTMEGNTFVIDTPGIKELGIFEIDQTDVGHFFPEMRALLNQCKFNNCKHMNEPKCMVKQKVDEGEIAISRYQNYLGMLQDFDGHR
ncbi:MAG TPA: ribosome small subunit-dependent GTPase A [Cytophagaceae bacterium]|jgi:ribosome biogenesis GTPase